MADSSISGYFSKKLNKINSFLTEKHDEALQNPELLVSFVDRELLKVWSAKNTVRAMLGVERWSQLSNTETEQLITAYENTIRRYLFEILEQYKDQLATVESVRLNTKGNKGWLRVTLESQSLPDFNVDLKIYKESTLWTVYDFSFQGISFVKMKRGFFRNTFDRHGVEGVIEQLNQKNQEFKQSLLASNDE
jgi:phospholipid transport system substrate-binding protein